MLNYNLLNNKFRYSKVLMQSKLPMSSFGKNKNLNNKKSFIKNLSFMRLALESQNEDVVKFLLRNGYCDIVMLNDLDSQLLSYFYKNNINQNKRETILWFSSNCIILEKSKEYQSIIKFPINDKLDIFDDSKLKYFKELGLSNDNSYLGTMSAVKDLFKNNNQIFIVDLSLYDLIAHQDLNTIIFLEEKNHFLSSSLTIEEKIYLLNVAIKNNDYKTTDYLLNNINFFKYQSLSLGRYDISIMKKDDNDPHDIIFISSIYNLSFYFSFILSVTFNKNLNNNLLVINETRICIKNIIKHSVIEESDSLSSYLKYVLSDKIIIKNSCLGYDNFQKSIKIFLKLLEQTDNLHYIISDIQINKKILLDKMNDITYYCAKINNDIFNQDLILNKLSPVDCIKYFSEYDNFYLCHNEGVLIIGHDDDHNFHLLLPFIDK